MAYYPNISFDERMDEERLPSNRDACVSISVRETILFHPTRCSEKNCNSFLCQSNIQPLENDRTARVEFPVVNNTAGVHHLRSVSILVRCPDEHLTHDFLSCDSESICGVVDPVSHCTSRTDSRSDPASEVSSTGRSAVTTEMFECYNRERTVHYSLLCDFRHDCSDQSDETHCKHQVETDKFRYQTFCLLAVKIRTAEVSKSRITY